MINLLIFFALFTTMTGCEKKIDANPANKVREIVSFSPSSGHELTDVTVIGKNFSSNTWENLIIIGGYHLVPVSSASDRLQFRIPSGIAAGSYSIYLRIGQETVTAAGKFQVTSSGGSGPVIPSQVVPVMPSTVRECFNQTRKGGVHPRLIFSTSDIERIKALALTDQFVRPTYEMIISKADEILSSPILEWGLDGANLRVANLHKISNDQIPYLVLAYQFTKDPRYAVRCWAQLDKMCNYQDWGAARHFLDAGIAAKGVAIAYDGLYDYLSIEQRIRLVGAVRKFVLEPGKTQIETGTGAWKWYLTDNNWNGICHGGMIMAALACYETDPDFMSSVIALSANGIPPYLESLEPDGASEEGMMYWGYGLSNTFLALESLKKVLSTSFGLAGLSGFKKTGWFPYLVSGPAGTATVGDDYLYYGVTNKFLSYFWFAGNTSDADLARTHYNSCLERNAGRTEKMNGWFDLIFYDPDLVNRGSQVSLPVNGFINGADYMFVREDGSDLNSMYVGMHSGDNNASHGHLDAGTFFIQALGINFVVGNLGREDPYPSDYFTVTSPAYNDNPANTANTRGRFYYYRIRTESKSCLVINPDARPEQSPFGVAAVIKEGADNNGGFYVIDLTSCYSRDVSDYKRGIKLNRSNKLITIQDEFIPTKASTIYWLAQSPATDGLVISSDGKTVSMVKNGKILYAYIKSPSDAVFEKADRSETEVSYLPETSPLFSSIMAGKNSVNKWYGKLMVRFTSTANTPVKIRIDFSTAQGVITPDLADLHNWTTTN